MIITPHNEGEENVWFTVDYGNGKVEEVKECVQVTELLGYNALEWVGNYRPYYADKLTTLRKAVGLKFNQIEDFEGLLDSVAFQQIRLDYLGWVALALSILRRVDKLVNDYNDLVKKPDGIPDYVYRVVRWCSARVSVYWEETYGHRDNKLYDFDGIKQEAMGLRSLDERRLFLERVVHEIEVPFAAKLVQRCDLYPPARKEFINSDWHIAVIYRHTLSSDEKAKLREMYQKLKQSNEEQIKRAFFTVGVEASETQTNDEDISNSFLSNNMPQLQWEGTQTDLVFIMDCLKEAGFLTATDAQVTRHFSYGGTARDKAKTYRDLRKKIKEGQAYADGTRLAKLIELLSSSPR